MNKYINFSEQLLIQRRKEACVQMGIGRSTIYNFINEGVFPPPFSIGDRSVGFFAHETNAILRAMAAGKSKKEIKELVSCLIEYRQNPNFINTASEEK
jgi:prophage regulatory protein